MNDGPSVGLRERKRQQTAKAIHDAAIELVLERGLDAATIDAISEHADVSTRTFFNYYASKEDALLGIDEVAVAAELEKVDGPDPDTLRAVLDLIFAIFEAGGTRPGQLRLKREVMRKYPQLMTRQMVRVAELEDRLSIMIAGWLADNPRFAADSETDRVEQARLVLGICLTTVRMSMRQWANASEAQETSATFDRATTYERAVATLRTVMEKLT